MIRRNYIISLRKKTGKSLKLRVLKLVNAGLSQKKISMLLGVHNVTICRWLGATGMLSSAYIRLLEEKLPELEKCYEKKGD